MNKKYVVANWKNHPDTLAEAEQILDSVDEHLGLLPEIPDTTCPVDMSCLSLVFCPPFVFLEEVGKILKTSHLLHQAELGAQDISVNDDMTLTGEISGPMLSKLGVRYIIVGHSERRWKLEESDEVVNQKLKAVLRNTMVPIVCVGEKVRDKNFTEFLKNQVLATFAGLSADEVGRCIIAYEPVWAVSSNPGAKPDTLQNSLESIRLIREALISDFGFRISSLFLYGGSVTSRNVKDFLNTEETNGVLVGGASVDKEEFVKILSAIV